MDNDWRVFPLDFRVRLRRAGHFPAFKGVVLRGAFGVQFRKTVCTTRAPRCPDCRLLSTCAFPYVFTSPAQTHASPELRSHRTCAPHPFALSAPDDGRTAVPADTLWTFRITLVGQAAPLLPYFVHAFLGLEQAGLGPERVPFELLSVSAAVGAKPWEVYRPGAGALRYPPAGVSWPRTEPAGGVVVRFHTLTRIASEGRIQTRLPFAVLARAALRRVRALHALYCASGAGPAAEADYRELLAAAARVETADAELQPLALARRSTRTQERMVFDGVRGWVKYAGSITQWLPVLKAAAQVNVGKGATFGFGVMAVDE